MGGNAFEGFPVAANRDAVRCSSATRAGSRHFGRTRSSRGHTIPPVVLTEILVAERARVAWRRDRCSQSRSHDTPSLTLSHDQNMFSFEFAALSYVDPQRNQYRYMLEPLDRSWNRVDSQRRIATFTTLPAGHYTLRVQASNNRGVWNEQGVTLRLQILPPWWGTTWFRSAGTGVLLALLWAGYQLRVRQLRYQFDLTLEARVGERTRIARELHDTLLQSFHGLLLRFQTASHLIPERSAEAKQELDTAIQSAANAITEGRDAVQGLRASTLEGNDLALAIRTLGDELATGLSVHPTPAFHVGVEGSARELRPIVRDEIYKIAAEALRNSFRHALAAQVEVEIHYDRDEFRLRVRDDGKGIEQAILAAQGIEGHFYDSGLSSSGTAPLLIDRNLPVSERGGRGNGGGAADSSRRRLCDGAEGLLVVTTVWLRHAGTKERRCVLTGCSSPIRILAVDDHPLVRDGIARLIAIQTDMIVVAQADNGREAIQQFRTHRPDITLMDLQMPEMNGLDALIAIRTEFPDAKTIVLTTYEGDVHILRALKAGAQGYLLKNTLHLELLQTIRAVHAGKRSLSPEVSFQVAEHMSDQTLTPAEVAVLRLIADGNANKQIADQLRVTEDTVKGRVKSILAKLDANDRTHAAIIGLRRGIIDLSSV